MHNALPLAHHSHCFVPWSTLSCLAVPEDIVTHFADIFPHAHRSGIKEGGGITLIITADTDMVCIFYEYYSIFCRTYQTDAFVFQLWPHYIDLLLSTVSLSPLYCIFYTQQAISQVHVAPILDPLCIGLTQTVSHNSI